MNGKLTDSVVVLNRPPSRNGPARWFIVVVILMICAVIITALSTWWITVSFLQPYTRSPFRSWMATPQKNASFTENQNQTELLLEDFPSFCWPTHYNITIRAYFSPKNDPIEKLFKFWGFATINISCTESVNQIYLNILNLNITFLQNNGALAQFNIDKKRELLIVESGVLDSEHNLYIEYNGVMRNGSEPDTSGFYYYPNQVPRGPSRSPSHSGSSRNPSLPGNSRKEEYSATTQFQSIEARSAYPCFDKPKYRATFSLTLIHRPRFRAVSNMPIIDQKNLTYSDGLWIMSEFGRTPNMSTYLLAWSITADYKYAYRNYTSPLPKGGTVQIGVYGKSGGNYLVRVINRTMESLQFFETYLQSAYTLPKLDAIISMFYRFGGMENWGMVTYRRQSVHASSSIVHHEVAHQWFGNLITCNGWDEIWLNEGFTSHLQMIAMAQKKPATYLDTLAIEKRIFVLHFEMFYQLTGLLTSPGHRDLDLTKPFVANNYYKAPQILHMVYTKLGPMLYRQCLRDYVRDNQYKSVTMQNVIDSFSTTLQSLNKSHSLDVHQFFTTWSSTPGFLLIKRSRTGQIISKDSVVHGEIFTNTSLVMPFDLQSEGCPSSTVFYGVEQCDDLLDYDQILHKMCSQIDGDEVTSLPVIRIYQILQDLLLLSDIGRIPHSFMFSLLKMCWTVSPSPRPHLFRLWSMVVQLDSKLRSTSMYPGWEQHLHSLADAYIENAADFYWLSVNEDNNWKLRRLLVQSEYPPILRNLQELESSVRNGSRLLNRLHFELQCMLVGRMTSYEIGKVILMDKVVAELLLSCSPYHWHIQMLPQTDWLTSVIRNPMSLNVILDNLLENGLPASGTNSRLLRNLLDLTAPQIMGRIWLDKMDDLVLKLGAMNWSRHDLLLFDIYKYPIDSNTRWLARNGKTLARWLCSSGWC